MSGLAYRFEKLENYCNKNVTILLLGCLATVVKQKNDIGSRFLFISVTDDIKGIDLNLLYSRISQHWNDTYSINNRRNNGRNVSRPNVYILCTDGSELKNVLTNIENQLKTMSYNERLWKPQTQLIVILYTDISYSQFERFATSIIEQLWKNVVYNCAVLIMDKDTSSGTIYIADPFDNKNACGRKLISEPRVYRCGQKLTAQQTHFTSGTPKATNCTILVSVRDSSPFSYVSKKGIWEGLDVALVKTIAERLGLSVTWHRRPSGDRNNSLRRVNEFYDNVSRNEIDLAAGGCTVGYRQYYQVHYLRSHETQYLSFFVADSGYVSKFKVFHAMFPAVIWFTIIITIVLAIIIIQIYQIYMRNTLKKRVNISFLTIIGIVLEKPIKISFHSNLRIFFFSFILPIYGLSSMYTTYLHSMTIHPPSQRDIRQLKDLIEAELPVYATHSMIEGLKQVEVKRLRFLSNKLKPIEDNEEAAALLQQQRDFALLDKDLHMMYIMTREGYTFHKLSFNIYLLNVALVTPKGSLFYDRFNRLVKSTIEHGLYLKWEVDIMRGAYLERRKSYKGSKRSEIAGPRALNLSDLYPVFVAISCGLLVSAVTFLLERVIHSGQRDMRKKNIDSERFSATNSPVFSSFHF